MAEPQEVLETKLALARQRRDDRIAEAQSAFDADRSAADQRHLDALQPCQLLEQEIEALRARIVQLTTEADAARDDSLRPARRTFRQARVDAGNQYDEDCSRARKRHEWELQDSRTDLRVEDWRLGEVEGVGECLLYTHRGVMDIGHGPEAHEETSVVGLVTEHFIISRGRVPAGPLEDPEGVSWWDWPLEHPEDAEPIWFTELLASPARGGLSAYHEVTIPAEFADWIRARTEEAISAGTAHVYLREDVEKV